MMGVADLLKTMSVLNLDVGLHQSAKNRGVRSSLNISITMAAALIFIVYQTFFSILYDNIEIQIPFGLII